MNCLEFKKLALSEPGCKDIKFLEHSQSCSDCLKYLNSVRQMDADLASSLDVTVPDDLMARLKLNQLIEEEEIVTSSPVRKYAIAASFALAVFVAGFVASGQFGVKNAVGEDYQTLMAGVVEHMNRSSFTPVWDAAKANKNTTALLASYDSEMKMKYLENLQFGRICPMGKYRGLHASLETEHGQVTFAYIKGDSVGELLDAGYEGYVARVKPVRGGNLIIFSKTEMGLQQADTQLEEAMYWDI